MPLPVSLGPNLILKMWIFSIKLIQLWYMFCSEAISPTVDVEEVEKEEGSAGENVDQSPTHEEESESTVDPNNKDGQIHRHFAVVGLNLVGMIFVSPLSFSAQWSNIIGGVEV